MRAAARSTWLGVLLLGCWTRPATPTPPPITPQADPSAIPSLPPPPETVSMSVKRTAVRRPEIEEVLRRDGRRVLPSWVREPIAVFDATTGTFVSVCDRQAASLQAKQWGPDFQDVTREAPRCILIRPRRVECVQTVGTSGVLALLLDVETEPTVIGIFDGPIEKSAISQLVRLERDEVRPTCP